MSVHCGQENLCCRCFFCLPPPPPPETKNNPETNVLGLLGHQILKDLQIILKATTIGPFFSYIQGIWDPDKSIAGHVFYFSWSWKTGSTALFQTNLARLTEEVAASTAHIKGRNLDLPQMIHPQETTLDSNTLNTSQKHLKAINTYDFTYHIHYFDYQKLTCIKTTGATPGTYHQKVPSLCPSHHVFWAKGLLPNNAWCGMSYHP